MFNGNVRGYHRTNVSSRGVLAGAFFGSSSFIGYTKPIVGPGVHTISTETPFMDSNAFSPFNAKEILGLELVKSIIDKESLFEIRY